MLNNFLCGFQARLKSRTVHVSYICHDENSFSGVARTGYLLFASAQPPRLFFHIPMQMSFHEFQNRLECLPVFQSPYLSSMRSENQHVRRISLNIQTRHKLTSSVFGIQTYVNISLHQFHKPPVRTRTPFESRVSWPHGDFNRLWAREKPASGGKKQWHVEVREVAPEERVHKKSQKTRPPIRKAHRPDTRYAPVAPSIRSTARSRFSPPMFT